MSDFEIIETKTDHQGNVQSFLIYFSESGEISTVGGTPSNVLLYKHGLYEVLESHDAIRLSSDPDVVVGSTGNPYSYVIRVRDDTIQTTPGQSEEVLQGLLDAIEDGDIEGLLQVVAKIRNNQVRQHIVNELVHMFDSFQQRIEIQTNGWLVDGLFLVDWNGSLYTKDDDPSENDRVRRGGKIVEADQSFEFVTLRQTHNPEATPVTLSGEEYMLSEREVLFLSKIEWLLHREDYHVDDSFWNYVERFTERSIESVDDTQEPML